MAYIPFDKTKPDATSQTLTQMGQSMLNNEKAVRDMVIMHDSPSWSGSVTTAGVDEFHPAVITYVNGTERIKETYTYSSGRVSTILYEYSSNSGSSYDTIGTRSYTWGTNGGYVSDSWS